MNTHANAQRFYDQLRALAPPGTDMSTTFPPALLATLIDKTLAHVRPEEARNPTVRESYERIAERMLRGETDAVFSELLTEMQDDIEKTAAESIRDGLDVSRRPLVRHMTTGQLNAVSLRVPDDPEAYLVLVEDQMQTFASEICQVVALAVPSDAADTPGLVGFRLDAGEIAERIADLPELSERFATIVTTYAATGRVGIVTGLDDDVPGAYANFANTLQRSFQYFLLGHEYAHVLLGHLDTTVSSRGVLPVAGAEALVYSWREEMQADLTGAIVGLQASVNHGGVPLDLAYLGMTLFFDALDVMDRAVALLQTGDEHALQLGSHPPAALRKQRLREALAKIPPLQTDRSVKLAEAQGQLVRLLWGRTRPALTELRRRGGYAAPTWRPIPKETDDDGRERDDARQAAAYGQLGMAAQGRGELAEADRFLALARDASDRGGDRAGSALYSGQLGIVASLRERDDEGRDHLARALAGYRDVGDEAGLADCHYQWGVRFALDYDESVRHLETARALHEKLGDRSRAALVTAALGSLAKNSGQYREAETLLARALSAYESLGDQTGIDRCRMSMDDLRERRGREGLFTRFRRGGRRP